MSRSFFDRAPVDWRQFLLEIYKQKNIISQHYNPLAR